MKLWTRVRRLARRLFRRKPVRRETVRVVLRAPVLVRRPKPIYRGEGSGTRARIIEILSDGRPRNREMIAAELDVTTAAIHLPRMIEDGILTSEFRDRRKWYRLVEGCSVSKADVDFESSGSDAA